jgi:hypothetical protein
MERLWRSVKHEEMWRARPGSRCSLPFINFCSSSELKIFSCGYMCHETTNGHPLMRSMQKGNAAAAH